MSKINKQALREAAEKALPAMQRLLMMPNDELFDEAQLNVDGDVEAANAFNLLAGPETMLALLDELEAAQSYAKERDEENQDLMLTIGRLRVERETIESERDNALCELLPGVQYMDPPDGGCVTPLEQVRRMVADYRERIAELEAREVKLPQRYSMLHRTDFDEPYHTEMVYMQHQVLEALHDAGIRTNGEG